jgi:hypothetical protein
MAWMVAGFYPTAGEQELCLAADYLCWAFTLDDLGDETPLGRDPGTLAHLFGELEKVFTGGAIEVSRALRPAVTSLIDIVARLSAIGTRRDVEAFHQGNMAYFGGMLWEANNRAENWTPHESTFLSLRPAAGAVPPFFALIEPQERISLPPHVKKHPSVEEICRLAGGIVCWINDVLSHDKERSLGDVHNLALIYEHHRSLSPGQALMDAVKLSNTEVQGFLLRADALPSFGDETDRELRRYVDTLASMMRITRDWTFGSARYSEDDEFAALLSA